MNIVKINNLKKIRFTQRINCGRKLVLPLKYFSKAGSAIIKWIYMTSSLLNFKTD